MSDQTTNLQLPFLMPAQAQKHVTVNESLMRLDALVQMAVESRSVPAQPASPADGQVWICPAGKTGVHWDLYADHALAYYRDGVWEQIQPRPGWTAWVRDEARQVMFNGAGWVEPQTPGAFRNALLNGALGVWARGTSFSHGAALYTADRWRASRDGDAAGMTVSRVAGQSSAYALRHARDAGDVASDGESGVLQILDEDASRALAQVGAATLSFKVRMGADFTGTLHALIHASDTASAAPLAEGRLASGDVAAEATLALSGHTDQRAYSVTLAGLAATTRRIVASFNWRGHTGTAGAACWFEIEQVQLEAGSSATPFEHRPAVEEESLCRAYFERLGHSSGGPFGYGYAGNATTFQGAIAYSPKRATPSISYGGAIRLIYNNTATDVLSATIGGPTRSNARFVATVSGGLSQGRGGLLLDKDGTGYVDIDAEL